MMRIYLWPAQRNAWLALFIISLSLLAAAAYFQYGLGLEPCVKCVYQRMAVIGVALFALLGYWGARHALVRLIALAGVIYSAIEGLLIAYDHWDLQTSKNAFFAVCESNPNFPSWAPLHEWLPSYFAAPGLCGDIDWSFLGVTMPAWMTFIFAGVTITVAVAGLSHIIYKLR
ncbi:disulfide bond formation protein DsbB [Idiomarina sp.]|uniref:disulfide bond formation protein DsbB n=1 Tax=Idiomarina sp. TaxID=1874361 RepID=UPI002EA70B0A|nr:disulfide bond formation protein DsbB [Pseudomonadota bacterium]